jgi:hypothetical protein
MDKLFLFRTLVAALMVSLLVFDGLPLLIHPANAVPEQHKEVLLTGALLWIATTFFNQGSNRGDWAGQFYYT